MSQKTYDFRLPYITSDEPKTQLKQMQSYMYQLVEQLNYALEEVDKKQTEVTEIIKSEKSPITDAEREQEASDTFSSIKSLIIKSADIIRAYEEQMSVTFNGMYVAQSDFGDYKQETQNAIEANSQSITQLITDYQTIVSPVIQSVMKTNAYIRSGELDSTVQPPIIGIEVGQTTTETVGGQEVEVFNKFARFTAEGIYFYLMGQTTPIALFSGTSLFITSADITSSMRQGDYQLDFSNGITYKWVG